MLRRKTPMPRTSLRRKEWTPAPKDGPTAPVRRLERAVSYSGGVSGKAVAKEPVLRDKSYRRWVASLPCFECRIHGYSQCAHPNSGKAKGRKNSDEGCFPMCADRVGVKGCHSRFDQYELVSRGDMPEYDRRALEWTKEQRIGPT
jgi:hypothetical protein